MVIWTIGHSTRPVDEFLALLHAHEIHRLVDVRTIPRSRHNPQFDQRTFRKSLEQADIAYSHAPELGGLRKSRSDSINLGWKNTSFRGYADYMQTEQFWSALEELMASSAKKRTAIMCAEAVPWRCHRSLIADALVSRDWTVRHIISAAEATPHRLAPFARIHEGKVMYPVE